MKAIVIGISTAGKTTLIKHLREHSKLAVGEIDEELTKLNNGKFPTDEDNKKILGAQIIQKLLESHNVIFFTNTDYFYMSDLTRAKDKNFKIILLELSRNEFNKRNEQRVMNMGYEDHSRWLDGMLDYQEVLKKNKLVDKVIRADQVTEKIANELLFFLN